jgi:hypothetical protein
MQNLNYYKAFSKQFKECQDNGNLMKIDTTMYGSFPSAVLVCIKYKSICHSGVCRDERIKKDEKVT